MGIQEEQLQQEPTKPEDDSPEPTIISRRQAELDEANDRLKCTAQNFSFEWKSFLGYAMKIKQQRTISATPNLPTDEKDLEDLLLKTQDGLVLLRGLHNRRERQWNDVFELYGYQRPLLTLSSEGDDNSDQDATKQTSATPQWLSALVSKLLALNQQVAATAHCVVRRSQLTASQDHTLVVPIHSPHLVKQRAQALETHHRLQHVMDSALSIADVVQVEDVNMLMQFDHMKHQQAVVLERFCVRLKWLPVSHRFHLQQRMRALVHQQKAKNTPRPSVATAQRNSQEHLHCPLFIMTTPHFTAELKTLALKNSLVVPGDNDTGETSEEYKSFRQDADALLTSAATAFPSDNAINTDGKLEMGLETLVHSYTRNSRWELIQHGFIGNCEPGQGHLEDTLSALRNEHKIDSLLASEWELLSLDDVGYLRVRLEALSRAHMNRAKVDVAKSDPAAAGVALLMEAQGQTTEEAAEDDEADNEIDLPFATTKSGSLHSWNSDALYSLYVLLVSSCRAKRLSLLRLLNYLHFIQLRQGSLIHSTKDRNGPRQKPPVYTRPTSSQISEDTTIPPWNVTKCEKTGDYIIKRRTPSTGNEDVDGEDDDDRDHEFIFATARRDLEVLELQMLRMASIFIFKQEYESLPTSPYKRSSDQSYGSGDASDTVVATIDRLQVLRDVYDCEVAFQEAKVQLVDKLLDSGLQYAPRSHDLSDLGFSASEAQAEPFANILFPLLERRPLVDFSHAYFFESYASETILLELQASLVQQMEQYFQRLEWCATQEFAVGDKETDGDHQRQWLCRQILGTGALVRLYSQQKELVREADEKWFTATSVGEFHALQHALLEQTLVVWSLIVKLELPDRPVRCLERTAGDLLSGCGWQLVLPPQFLSDVCRTLHDESTAEKSSSPMLIEWLAKALELEDWRQQLAKNVYEGHLLERIHQFQFGFVKQAAAFDTASGGEQARHLAFFFGFGECDRTRFLQPLAAELETSISASKPATPHSKSVSEWLQAELSALSATAESCDNDDVASHGQRWSRSVLLLQQQYVAHMEVAVLYQDAIGADVFEFAASYPYVCLANSLAPESSSSSDQDSTLAMDINTVRTKYAKEIADKVAEEMRTSCFPYWKRLESLKLQLQERFTTAPKQTSDELTAVFTPLQLVEVDTIACGHFLDEESCHPRLLTALNKHLQRLRNEKRLMQQLSPATRARCAFTSSSTADRSANESQTDEERPSGLTKWLMVKLHQLKVDLQIRERPKVEQLLLTPPASASCSSPSTSAQRTKRTWGTNRSSLESCCSDTHTLLQTIPSFRRLLQIFAMTGNYEKPTRDSSGGAASAHATRLHEHREETLRTLVFIFHQFSSTIDLLQIRCGSRFASTRPQSSAGGQRHLPTLVRPKGSLEDAHTGLSRLERWQTQFHCEIRQLLDQITSKLSPEAAVATGDLFDTNPEHLQNQHHASLLRQEVSSAIQETNAHLIRLLRCTSNFALLQTYQRNAGIRVRKRRQHLITFQTILENTTAEVTMAFNVPQGQIQDTTMTTTKRNESEDGIRLTAKMKQLVRAGDKALFGEARPREREREWQAFEDAVSTFKPRDSAYVEVVTRLLELHRVYINENCRVFLRLAEETAMPSLASQCTAENQALLALDDLWERFHFPAWDSLVDDEISVRSGRSTAPVVGGENVNMKKRLLGTADLDMGTSSSSLESGFSSPKDLSYALRSLQMGAATVLAQFCNTSQLVLPPPNSIEDQVVYLQLSIELTWVDADMKELEDQYKMFLFHRKTHREHERAPNYPQKPPRNPQPSPGPSSSPFLLTLSKYYHEEGITGDKTQQPDASSSGDSEPLVLKSKKQESAAAFVVPVHEMARFLHDITNQCVKHNQQQLNLLSASTQQLHEQFQAAAIDHQKIEKQFTQAKVEERIRREAFAVDHAFHLYFEVEALRKQLSVLEARREIDQQVLRCELNAAYEEKLHTMHAELLNKQQKFAEYRTTMQRELQSVIQGAHSQFVGQLLDYSGTIPSTTKTSVSTLLRGQQDIVRIKSENASMKQALLKVQALGDIQHQTQTSARERELRLTQRYATAEAHQRNEVDQLQTYVKQLEGSLSKLSQEKTYFQVKWATAQKQMEVTAKRKREAKIRALSASCTWTTLTPGATGSDGDDFPAFVPNTRVVPDNASDTESVVDTTTVRPRPAVGTVDDTGKQERQRLEAQYLNSTRHYQNEIRRLQQQVTREIREKAAIAEQLTQLRQYESSASIQPRDGLPLVEDSQKPRTPLGEETLGRRGFLLSSSPRRAQSASPRALLKPHSCVAAPPDRTTTPRRPSSSFSPRASLLRAQVTVGSGPQPPALVPCSDIPAANTPSSRPTTVSSISATPARKFHVVKRDINVVGGVAGVSNTFSVREPLPYH